MKKYLFLSFFLLSLIAASGQAKPKPKDKPPTPAEMNEMLKESQQAMDDMSPEDKKMMDSLGFKLPSTKNIPRFSDKEINKVAEDGERIVPLRDAAGLPQYPIHQQQLPFLLILNQYTGR